MFSIKNSFEELVKSTLITLTSFTLFDLAIQGYHQYHTIFIGSIVIGFVTYSIYKRLHQPY